jgi:hypothetical protein
VKASKHLASLLTTDWQCGRKAGCVAVSFRLHYLYLILSCYQLPFCEFPKHTTTLHYRYDRYCTFVLFVNQHFSGLPASGTHCSIRESENYNLKFPATGNVYALQTQCIKLLIMSTGTRHSFHNEVDHWPPSTVKIMSAAISVLLHVRMDRLCGLAVRVLDYRYRGPGFDSWALQKK